jgi:hypothetical protein
MEVIAMLKHCKRMQFLLISCFIFSGSNIFAMTDYFKKSYFSESSPCWVVLARYETETPIPTTTEQPNNPKKEKHFFLLMQFQDDKQFSINRTKEQNPIYQLLETLFPDVINNNLFIFDSRKIEEYKNKIRNITFAEKDKNILSNWWLQKRSTYYEYAKSLKKENIKNDQAVKDVLIEDLETFVSNINKLTDMQSLTNPMDSLISVAKTIPINETDNAKITAKKSAIQNNLKNALFNNFNESGIFKDDLLSTEIKILKNIIESIMTAHISYVADLATASALNALPRALYQEVEILCKNLNVKAPAFVPSLLTSRFWKEKAKTAGAWATAAVLGSIFLKYNK